MNKENNIIRPFNKTYFIFLGSIFTFSYIVFFYFRDLDRLSTYRNFLILSVFQILVIVVYRLILFKDKEYCNAVYGSDKPNYYDELPLNPCNVVTILTPLAILFKLRWIMAFCFYVSIIGPIFALIFPITGFEKYSVYKPRIILFYEYHWVCLFYPHLFIKSELFFPEYYDCLTAFGVCLIFGAIAYYIDRYLVTSKKDIYANFFFVYNPHFNPILEKFYSYIPYRFFYAIPAYGIFGLIFLLITFIVRLAVSTL